MNTNNHVLLLVLYLKLNISKILRNKINKVEFLGKVISSFIQQRRNIQVVPLKICLEKFERFRTFAQHCIITCKVFHWKQNKLRSFPVQPEMIEISEKVISWAIIFISTLFARNFRTPSIILGFLQLILSSFSQSLPQSVLVLSFSILEVFSFYCVVHFVLRGAPGSSAHRTRVSYSTY